MIAKKLRSFLSFVGSFQDSLGRDPSDQRKRVLVLGNSACDSDSVFGSLIWAFLKSHSNPEANYIPVINSPKRDFSIRFIPNALLRINSISPDLLLFHDHLPQLLQNQKETQPLCELSLFDHNQIEESLQKAIGQETRLQITEINDHHQPPKTFMSLSPGCSKNIQHLGSCSTIAGRELLKSHPSLICFENLQMILTLLTIIRLDTFDFRPNLKEIRWVQEDADVYNQLIGALAQSGESKDLSRKSLEENVLESLKEALLSGFSVDSAVLAGLPALLSSDYKKFNYASELIGYSVLPISYKEAIKGFNGIEKVVEEIKEFMEKEKLKILFQFFLFPEAHAKKEELVRQLTEGSLMVNRELQVFCFRERDLEFIDGIIDKEEKVPLVQKEKGETNGVKWSLYDDPTRSLSRKMLEPIVAYAFHERKPEL